MSSLPEHPHPTAKIGKAELLAALQNFLPADAILHSAEQLRPYECDGLSAYRQVPMLVVLPSNVEQVQQVLRLCYDNNVPVVARGAGTSLSGGALPLSDGVLLSLAKFNQILDIDTFNRTARVQPGVRNLAISEAAKPHGRNRSLPPQQNKHQQGHLLPTRSTC